MRVHFDEKADAIYLRFDESKILESEEVYPGIVDFNEHNEVRRAALDRLPRILPASKHLRRRS